MSDATDATPTDLDPAGESSVSGLPLPPPAPTLVALPSSAPASPTSSGGPRYERLRVHASGGIGRVWLARDTALGREVALKELRPDRAADGDLAARFLAEARVTGQLEHPGIVPVYELALDPDGGPPFYTMRFIRGRTLSEAIAAYHRGRRAGESRPLELRALLDDFVMVCNAVAYAHARGVIHRDLKGLNVVLGDFGEVMVLDWGLAKLAGNREQEEAERKAHGGQPVGTPHTPCSGLAATEEGTVLGTPWYMPPEQAEGQHDRVDARSDVYSLGVILFEILTGRLPHEGDSALDVLAAVLNRPAPRARAVEPSVPPALDAVIARALARRPEDRYRSAAELADDVRRYLADEPVSAWREPLAVRARRWVGRHRTLVTAAGAAVVVAAVLLAGATALLGRANEREREARERAERNEKLATERGEQASKRFGQAMEAVQLMLTRVSEDRDRLAHEPRMELVRRKLLSDALAFYRRFLEEKGDDPKVRQETGRAHLRVGHIQSDLGEAAEARRHYDLGLALLGRLADEAPGEPEYRRDLAEGLYLLAILQRTRPAEAEVSLARAIALLEGIVATHPDRRDYRRWLAMVQNELGLLRSDHAGRVQEAEGPHRAALALRERLAREVPDNPDYAAEWSQSLHNVGWLHHQAGRLDEAEAAYAEAIAIRERLAKQHPDVSAYRQYLGRTLVNLAGVLRHRGRDTEAVEQLGRALALRRQLADDFPRVVHFQTELAAVHSPLAAALAGAGRNDEAEKTYRAGVALWEKLAKDHPETGHVAALAQARHDLGLLYERGKRPEEALAEFRKAVALREGLMRADPKSAAHARGLAWSHNNIGVLLRVRGDLAGAEKAHRVALEIRRRAAREHPHQPQLRADLATSLTHLGDLADARGEAEVALALLAEAAEVLTALLATPAPPAEWKRALSQALLRRVQVLAGLRRFAEALSDLDGVMKQMEGAAWLAAVGVRAEVVREVGNEALARARRGDHGGAGDLVARLADDPSLLSANLFLLARASAAAAWAASEDETLPAARRAELAARHAGLALRLLHRARAANHFVSEAARAELRDAPDFAALRLLPEFQRLLRAVEEAK